jgi:hypothetical protein
MAFEFTNKNNVSLPLAVFLMHDNYDYDNRSNSISVTGLLKPLREIVLRKQNPESQKTVEVSDLIASTMGNALHSACEASWSDRNNVLKALQLFGTADSVANTIKINPPYIKHDEIPIYIEQRSEKELDGFIISGKYDLVMEGTVHDYKSTSTWAYVNQSNREDYIKQGSMYRWLNPDKITNDYIQIHYLFTDWSIAEKRKFKKESYNKEDYPSLKVASKSYPLWDLEKTENFIKKKLQAITNAMELPQESLPECTNEDLWIRRNTEKYKYYANPAKTDRASKVFGYDKYEHPETEANIHLAEKGTGIVKHFPAMAVRCRYCSVQPICSQAASMLIEGRLDL